MITRVGSLAFVFVVTFAYTSTLYAVRVTNDLVVGYDFNEGSGNTVGDSSGNGVPLDLTIHDPSAATWGAGFLSLHGDPVNDESSIVSSASAANVPSQSTAGKVINAIQATNEITMEVWVQPLNVVENGGPARIMGIALDGSNRNVSLTQNQTDWEARLRTSATTGNGTGPRTRTVANSATTALQHVVYTRDASGAAAIYVDNVSIALLETFEFSGTVLGNINNWNSGYDLGIGNELNWVGSKDRDWRGDIYLAAIYSRALSPTEVAANYDAGPLAAIVPEPSCLFLASAGLLSLAAIGRRRHKSLNA